MKIIKSSFVICPTAYISLISVIRAAIAVLNFISSISAETFLIVLWIDDSSFAGTGSSLTKSVSAATLSINLLHPLTELSFQGVASP